MVQLIEQLTRVLKKCHTALPLDTGLIPSCTLMLDLLRTLLSAKHMPYATTQLYLK
jgi:hypothetical protein